MEKQQEKKEPDDFKNQVTICANPFDLRFKDKRTVYVTETLKLYQKWIKEVGGEQSIEEDNKRYLIELEQILQKFITTGETVYASVDGFYIFAEIDYTKSQKEVSNILSAVYDDKHKIDKPRVVKICSFCRAVLSKPLVCKGCRVALYCNPICQRADWKSTHRATCKLLFGPKANRVACKRMKSAFVNRCLTNRFITKIINSLYKYCTYKACLCIVYKYKQSGALETEDGIGHLLNREFLEVAARLNEMNLTHDESKLLMVYRSTSPIIAGVMSDECPEDFYFKNKHRLRFEASEEGSDKVYRTYCTLA